MLFLRQEGAYFPTPCEGSISGAWIMREVLIMEQCSFSHMLTILPLPKEEISRKSRNVICHPLSFCPRRSLSTTPQVIMKRPAEEELQEQTPVKKQAINGSFVTHKTQFRDGLFSELEKQRQLYADSQP